MDEREREQEEEELLRNWVNCVQLLHSPHLVLVRPVHVLLRAEVVLEVVGQAVSTPARCAAAARTVDTPLPGVRFAIGYMDHTGCHRGPRRLSSTRFLPDALLGFTPLPGVRLVTRTVLAVIIIN